MTSGNSVEESTRQDYLSLVFRDGLDMPIEGLTFIATFPSGEMCTAESSARGAIALPIPSASQGEVKIEVKDETGGKQTVCAIDLDRCDGTAIVRSPKTKARVSLQPHQQVVPRAKPQSMSQPRPVATTGKARSPKPATQPAEQPAKVDTRSSWWDANGAWGKAWAWITSKHHFFGDAHAANPAGQASVAKGLSSAGQPLVAVIGPEAPNKENLRLGRNNIYREPILEASKRLGLIPQALCALMDCEAGKITEKLPLLNADGTPAKDRKGQPILRPIRERWNANAGNAQSGAAGLTQFLASTWLTHVLIPGYYIHDKSVANGWVKHIADGRGNKRWMFVLADGSATVAPYRKRASDDNVKKCLAMRMDPAWSINAAADYGNANLKVLLKAGLKLSGLNDMERAKLMYLMHHEGEGCGPLFIKNKLRDRTDGVGGVARLKQVFAMQLGPNGHAAAERLIDLADGDVEAAYREWLASFIDSRFNPDNVRKYFFQQPIGADALTVLMKRIGGETL